MPEPSADRGSLAGRLRRRLPTRPQPSAGDRLIREDEGVRRHLRRASIAAPVAALLAVAQGYGLAALVVAAAQRGAVDHVAIAVLILAAAARGVLNWWLERSGRRAAAAAIGHLREELVASAATVAAAAPGSIRAGEVAADAVTALPAIESYVGRFLAQQPVAAATTVVMLIAIGWTDLLSAALLAPTIPLLIVFLWLVGSAAGRTADARLQSLQLLGAHLLDVLRGLVDLRAFGRSRHQQSQVRLAAEGYRTQTMATLRTAFASGLVLELIAMLGTALVAVFGGVRLAEGSGELAAILPALVLAPELYAPLRRMGAGYHEAADARVALDHLAAVREAGASATAPGTPGGPRAPRPKTAAVRLDAVTVAGGDRTNRLTGVTLALAPGELVALVGESGAGKSTLAQLVLGLLAPTSGRVAIGDAKLADCDLRSWHAACAWVAQDPVLLPESLRENIRLGAPRATDAAIAVALREAGLTALVQALPDGLDTRLGEDGARLSTGELRRLALARAVLTDADLIVLDEPTAQLDALTAERLRGTLERLRVGRTILLITHDTELAEHADRVVALEHGTITSVRAGLGGAHVAVADVTREAAVDRASHWSATPAAKVFTRATAAGADQAPTDASAHEPSRSLGLFAALRLIAPPRSSRAWRETTYAIALGSLSAVSAVAVLALSGGLIVKAASQPPVLTMTAVIVLVRMSSIVRSIARYGERLFAHEAALRILTELRVQVLAHVARHVPGRWGERPTAALDRVVGDVDRAADLLIRVLVPALSAIVAVLLGVLVAAVISPVAALTIVLGTAALALLVGRTGHRAGAALASAEPERALLARDVVTALSAGPELLLSGRAGDQLALIRARSRRLEAAGAQHGAQTAAIGGLIATGAAVLAGVVAVLVAGAVADGSLGAPFAAALILGALATAERLDGIADAGLSMPTALAAVGRLAPALTGTAATEPEYQDPADPLSATPSSNERGLVVEDVLARRGQRTILAGAGLTVAAGECVALEGENGAGKSTLLLIAAGLMTPQRGEARWNGAALAALPECERAAAVVLVPSMPHLFGGSLASNLRLADPDATDERLAGALEAVGLAGWFASLPDGLETLLGEHGVRASGGQRQRLGLARAWLSPAAVVLLDEPASHLPEADALDALEAVIGAKPGRGAVLISHRAAERRLAQRQLRLEDGLITAVDLLPSANPVSAR